MARRSFEEEVAEIKRIVERLEKRITELEKRFANMDTHILRMDPPSWHGGLRTGTSPSPPQKIPVKDPPHRRVPPPQGKGGKRA